MNLSELTKTVAQKTGQTQAAVDLVVRTTFSSITEAAKSGEQTSIFGFGSFSVSERAAGVGRNPRTGEEIKTKASKAVKFKMAKPLKDALNG